jgi:cysteine sulfinate desulfinase/cysteine desulfurase-like protein
MPEPEGLVGRPVDLDYNATTPVDPRVVDAALRCRSSPTATSN